MKVFEILEKVSREDWMAMSDVERKQVSKEADKVQLTAIEKEKIRKQQLRKDHESK